MNVRKLPSWSRNLVSLRSLALLVGALVVVACGGNAPDTPSGAGGGGGTLGGGGIGATTAGSGGSVASSVTTGGQTGTSVTTGGQTGTGGSMCGAGTMDCGGSCVSVATDAANCGGCGKACDTGATCDNGTCACMPGRTDCGAACVDTTTDSSNCGACGTVCGANQVCSNSQCVTSCAMGQTACSGSCVDLDTSLDHCGACAKACGAGQTCTGGACACGMGQTVCGGQCKDTATDSANCGMCGKACGAGLSCKAGSCVCAAGQTSCNGVCKTTTNDVNNCGACGMVCGAGQTCTNSICTGGGVSACGVLPINPNATQQAKNLLCYLYSQYGNHVLSGQQETSWAANPADDVNYIKTNTGDYPVVLGADYLYPNGTSTRAIAWWNAGGIPMICYHMGAPPLSDTYPNSQMAAAGGIDAVLTPGTASYTSFIQKLDYAAAELQKLQAANVAVLWRPFHEAGGSWFWWSKESGAQYVKLWKFMYNYFTNTKKLNNLIWMHPYDGSPLGAFYPGKAFVDIGGADTYGTNSPFTGMFNTTKGIVGSTVPIALHENGLIPDPAAMFNNNAAPWLLFNTWAGYETSGNTLAGVKSAYSNSHTVTRGEVPNLK